MMCLYRLNYPFPNRLVWPKDRLDSFWHPQSVGERDVQALDAPQHQGRACNETTPIGSDSWSVLPDQLIYGQFFSLIGPREES